MRNTIIIIGGGIGGLFLADKYKDEYNVILIEREDDVGGKIQTYNGYTVSTQTLLSSTKSPRFDKYVDNIHVVTRHIPHFVYHHYPKMLWSILLVLIILLVMMSTRRDYDAMYLILLVMLSCVIICMIPYFSSYRTMKCLGSFNTTSYNKFINNTPLILLLEYELYSIFSIGYSGFVHEEFLDIVRHIKNKISNKCVLHTNSNVVCLDKKQKQLLSNKIIKSLT